MMKPVYRNLPKTHPYYEPRNIVIKCPENQENALAGIPAAEPENAEPSNGFTPAATAEYSELYSFQFQPEDK